MTRTKPSEAHHPLSLTNATIYLFQELSNNPPPKKQHQELNTPCGQGGLVAYQIRYDAQGVTPQTAIKFMTDGILLQVTSLFIYLFIYLLLTIPLPASNPYLLPQEIAASLLLPHTHTLSHTQNTLPPPHTHPPTHTHTPPLAVRKSPL